MTIYMYNGHIATVTSWNNHDNRFYSLSLGKMQFGVLRRLSFLNGKTMKNNNSARNNYDNKLRDTEGHNPEKSGLFHI